MYLLTALAIGAGATIFMDLTLALRKRLFGVDTPDYSMVGRWLAHMTRGRFRHDSINTAPAMEIERVLGWFAHYLIGLAFATALLIGWGLDWACRPTLSPALIVGVASVAAPLFIMQPAMGAGVAASRTPDPWKARFRSLLNHAIFGLGLYIAGVVASGLPPFGCAST